MSNSKAKQRRSAAIAFTAKLVSGARTCADKISFIRKRFSHLRANVDFWKSRNKQLSKEHQKLKEAVWKAGGTGGVKTQASMEVIACAQRRFQMHQSVIAALWKNIEKLEGMEDEKFE